MKQANTDIRKRIDEAGLTHWQVAEQVGINHVTLSVWLRTELTDVQKKRIDEAIEKLTQATV